MIIAKSDCEQIYYNYYIFLNVYNNRISFTTTSLFTFILIWVFKII
jgi:hypothetical protein